MTVNPSSLGLVGRLGKASILVFCAGVVQGLHDGDGSTTSLWTNIEISISLSDFIE